jgi:DNA (cytosine-5)-methyltransferase 1
MTVHKAKYRLISLFSGAGGFDLGFETSGRWSSLLANDSHSVMCQTLRLNKGLELGSEKFLDDAEVREGDIRTIGEKYWASLSGVDLVLGGPPCQSFSVMGKHGGYDDTRGNLIYEFAKVVLTVQPKFFLFENVPNMRTGKWKREYQEFLKFLRLNNAYAVSDFLICCADYGAATLRRRVFVLGTRADITERLTAPPITHQPKGVANLFTPLKDYVTVEDAFKELPVPANAFDFPFLHFAPQHNPETVERFKRCPVAGITHGRLPLWLRLGRLLPPLVRAARVPG